MMKYPLLLVLFGMVLMGCEQKTKKQKMELKSGQWKGELLTQKKKIPFTLTINKNDSSEISAQLINADEQIQLDQIVLKGDSLFIPMHIFDAKIEAKLVEDKLIGYWVKNYVEDYKIPFEATFEQPRFEVNVKPSIQIDGKWEVKFASKANKKSTAIGLFWQQDHNITGTFMTPTGDYRYLEGVVEDSIIRLSTFDGEHAYLFEAKMNADGTLAGDFWSGKSWHDTWVAERNDTISLPDPLKLTFMQDGYESIDFAFPNLQGDTIRLSDPQFENKVVILQILGTWCPNCMDETKFYADWYQQNKNQGVEIIGLAFEKKADLKYAAQRVRVTKEKLGADYEFLIVGKADKNTTSNALPMLNHVMSFPTSIFIDRKGQVRRIHTGFAGPGTGAYFKEYKQEFEQFMEELLNE